MSRFVVVLVVVSVTLLGCVTTEAKDSAVADAAAALEDAQNVVVLPVIGRNSPTVPSQGISDLGEWLAGELSERYSDAEISTEGVGTGIVLWNKPNDVRSKVMNDLDVDDGVLMAIDVINNYDAGSRYFGSVHMIDIRTGMEYERPSALGRQPQANISVDMDSDWSDFVRSFKQSSDLMFAEFDHGEQYQPFQDDWD